MGETIAVRKLSKTAKRMKRRLDGIYRELCLYGCRTEGESFFADNYHTLSDACELLINGDPDARVSADFRLADALISICDTRIPPADDIILKLSEVGGQDRIFPGDVEKLKYAVVFRLAQGAYKKICSGKDASREITLLSDIDALDQERINDTCNPVAIALSEDRWYSLSDSRSKLRYREKIYSLAQKRGITAFFLAKELVARSSESGEPLTGLIGLDKHEPAAAKAAIKLALDLAAAAGISLAVGASVLELWVSALIFLPVFSAVKAVTDSLALRLCKHERLLRLELGSKEVLNTDCALVLSAVVNGADWADSLYGRLYKLYASNPQDNIKVVALCDLPAAPTPVTGEDKPVIDAIAEVINKLNELSPGRFCAVVRKRSYSKTQDEYMGADRKRGAIVELCRLMAGGKASFYAELGPVRKLVGIKYICAVDLDTEPYMDSVSELLSVMLHPANKPRIDDGKVTAGVGMVSPRMVTRLADSLSTGFSRGMGGIGSVSWYDSESMDIMQDCFQSGSFCGKGLISVEALLRCGACLPHESVLSHDILEGELLRTAYAGDIIFTEGFPKSSSSYYKRLDRWVRGDAQNIGFVFRRRFGLVSKLKLLENIRRAVTPFSVLLALLASFVIYPKAALAAALWAAGGYLFPQIYGLISTLIRQGFLSRRFYSGLLSQASLSGVRLIYELVTLPLTALVSIRAVLTGLIRLVTRKNMLEWTTSAAADGMMSDPVLFFFIPEVCGLSLLFSPCYLVRLLAVFFSIMPAVIILGQRSIPGAVQTATQREERELRSQAADMWRYFSDYVTETENNLPPDNVQFSPVYRIAHRTSPTNIGMYLMSVLAACDLRLISVYNMARRVSLTIASVERMEKYHGNLYNWYETTTLRLCPNPYVSSVDSGNFVCSLVALKEGLREYLKRCPELEGVIDRVEKLINDTDLGIFYDKVKGLMAIGINPEVGELDRSRYDFLMSEARLTSYYAIASRQVPKSHWLRLSRTSLSHGFYSGAASYSGTMFEYFMPEIFLKSPQSSISYESLRYALWCQKSYAASLSRPYGISESGYYSFDSELNYRYMAHGAPKTGVKRGLESDYVVSPYSTYLTLGYSLHAGMDNLHRLKKYGLYSRYGFYEALDFTKGEPEAVKSYMSHHVGMSILSCLNVLQDGIFQKRFMSDMRVAGASELLSERVRLDRSVFEDTLIKPKIKTEKAEPGIAEEYSDISPAYPKARLLTNGEYSLVLTDCGISSAFFRGKGVYRKTFDPLVRPKGAFFGILDGKSAAVLSTLDGGDGLVAEFGDCHAAYYRNTDRIKAGMRVALHKSMPCEIRSFAIENVTGSEIKASLISYIEPSLSDTSAESAHPAFDKMFLRLDVDPGLDAVIVTRSDGGSKPEQSAGGYMAVGFAEDILGTVSFDREEVLSRPGGVFGLFSDGRAGKIPPSYICEPDPCIFIRTEITLPPKTKTELNLFIVTADSMEELINRVSHMKRRFSRQDLMSERTLDPGSALANRLLPEVMFLSGSSHQKLKALAQNKLELNSLWELSVNTDLPLILINLNGRNDEQKLSSYLGAMGRLALSGIGVQLAVVYDDGGGYSRERYTLLVDAAKRAGLEGLIYSLIIPVDRSSVRPELITLLKAYACHIGADEIISGSEEPVELKKPVRIEGVEPAAQKVETPVALGGFSEDGGYVINEKPPLPWCHVLSSPQFGTLVSEGSLGFSYAFNSRELRLTPWDNDSSRDNLGERLILRVGGRYYDIVRGSAAKFSPCKAEYFFRGDNFSGSVSVGVSEKGMCKRIAVSINVSEDAELAYFCEPCLGPDRKHAHLVLPEVFGGSLILHSPASLSNGYMALSCDREREYCCDRKAFLTGDWSENISPCQDSAAAVVVRLSGESTVNFYLSYALDKAAAAGMPRYYSQQTDTRQIRLEVSECNTGMAELANHWMRYQALHARIWARTGFYQCSGAYGFRDQLQDAVGIMAVNPSICKSQILRACRAQFYEGDCLHWWHSLPGKKIKGIRTRISDDNLWLPYAVCEYVEKTGDRDILMLKVCYCAGIELGEKENEKYGEVYKTSLRESVYEHCRKAIDYRAGKTGVNGLMLIGTGDWNDGFNKLGEKGKGESVWLTEFYILVLRRFASLCKEMDPEYSRLILEYAHELESSIEQNGRDVSWYRRAYADDGTVFGSAESKVCCIDSIAQSFAQFAGLRDSEFTKLALSEAYARLADTKRGVVKLFTPPFPDNFEPPVGYISHYPDGIRENGGQYTHAAVWLGMACVRAGLSREGLDILTAISPVARSENLGYQRYKTEPYYICGDVYANKNCYARGGWSIYTGSAAWYYRAITEDILGIRMKDGRAYIKDPLLRAKVIYNGKIISPPQG